jgi:hypothetical protein
MCIQGGDHRLQHGRVGEGQDFDQYVVQLVIERVCDQHQFTDHGIGGAKPRVAGILGDLCGRCCFIAFPTVSWVSGELAHANKLN